MKRLFTLFLLLCIGRANAQSVIYLQTFNSGSASDWTLNTSDLGGTLPVGNLWLINNSYTAGLLGTTTADEPSGITGYPESYYMHINCGTAFSSFYGTNCNFLAGGTGETYFAAHSTPISTVGYTGVTFSFWWLCLSDATGPGDVYYRTSSTGAWTAITSMIPTANFYGSASWARDSIHLSAFDGQAFLEFGFQFTDGTSGAGSDPAFGVDDIMVTGTSGSTSTPPSISASPVSTSVCAGGTTSFTGTATGATSYQWQRSTTGTGGTFVNITSGMDGGIYGTSYTTTTLTITAPTITENGYAYQMVATNATGSTTTSPAVLTVNPVGSAGTIVGEDSVCVGASVSLSNSTPGGTWSCLNSDATVSSSGLVTGVMAGIDTVYYTITGGACGVVYSTLGVVVKARPNPVIYSMPGSILAVYGTYSSYQWLEAGAVIPGATAPTYVFTATNNYQVIVDSAGCTDTSAAQTFTLDIKPQVMLPTDFTIAQSEQAATIVSGVPVLADLDVKVYDLTGRVVTATNWAAGNSSLHINDARLASGIYLVQLKNENTNVVLKWVR